MKTLWRSGSVAPPFLTSLLDGEEWSSSYPRHFNPGKIAHDIHGIGAWVGTTAGLDIIKRENFFCPYRESNPDSVQATA
jgi:hypothetical protein